MRQSRKDTRVRTWLKEGHKDLDDDADDSDFLVEDDVESLSESNSSADDMEGIIEELRWLQQETNEPELSSSSPNDQHPNNTSTDNDDNTSDSTSDSSDNDVAILDGSESDAEEDLRREVENLRTDLPLEIDDVLDGDEFSYISSDPKTDNVPDPFIQQHGHSTCPDTRAKYLRCDHIDPFTNARKPAGSLVCSFSTAMQMRAAITFRYDQGREEGQQIWDPEMGKGNPSLSRVLSKYMTGLRKRKFKENGDPKMASRALDYRVLEAIYKRNVESWGLHLSDIRHHSFWRHQRTRSRRGLDWAGPVKRLMVFAVVLLAFTLLLRIDEVLCLEVEDLEFILGRSYELDIHHKKRKQNPFGGIHVPLTLRRKLITPLQRAFLRKGYTANTKMKST
ncbi:hypothetical protein VNI00_017049 [Paramarasmius palmivorus]|uniref:Uncharacterized protein n=1 Tax=Paramarasmius palmivorus TaxID=297713 RepID=A0AAW0B9W4_9AGAR